MIEWVGLPTQLRPPFLGLGLVQALLRVFRPLSQVLEQDDHLVHVDQPPFIGLDGEPTLIKYQEI